ncbi:hypothetical protein Pelo_11858 [Pelomyxa schiedti]|nr:hypothetical protein Pelo_11858 [Pelomyxa schiedti]
MHNELRNHLLWQRAKETVPDDSRELYKCPLCTDYVKHCWIDHKSRQHAVSDLYHHLQNHGGKDMHRSEIPPHQAHVGTYQADMLHSTPQIDRGLTQSNNQSPQVISFVATEACSGGAPLLPDNTCHLNSTALGSCDSDTESEQEESELPTSIGDPQFIRTTYGKVQSIVPTQKDEPYSCPLCASYSRPGWKFYNSRQSAINNLQQHFQQHIHQTRTHSDPRSPKATLSDQVAMLRAVLMAPAFAGGVVPCCRNNLAAQRNYKSTRERTVNILYQHLRGCCGCSKESEEVNTSTMQQQDFSAREASAPAFSSLELPVDVRMHFAGFFLGPYTVHRAILKPMHCSRTQH